MAMAMPRVWLPGGVELHPTSFSLLIFIEFSRAYQVSHPIVYIYMQLYIFITIDQHSSPVESWELA